MKFSDFFLRTRKEQPADAEVASHRLMLRCGMINKLASGIYTWLPLGHRVLMKVAQIVREEMDATGAQEMLMPALHPSELWKRSGRWQAYGPELLRIKDRSGREFCYAPTHEEVITSLAADSIDSSRQLPVNLYQIQWKFRDEIRPRFGVMRSREFLMKDAYSFDADAKGMQQSYQKMFAAYQRCFTRMGLRYCSVDADSGLIGGHTSREFQILADQAGENEILRCLSCGYHASAEQLRLSPPTADEPPLDANNRSKMRKLPTLDAYTIADIERDFKIPAKRCIKTLLIASGERIAAVLLRGDHELNLSKAQKIEKMDEPIRFASAKEVEKATSSIPGSLGPIGLKIPIYADFSTYDIKDMSFGANEKFQHYFDANWGVDLPRPTMMDLRQATSDDPCPDCGKELEMLSGIEVGHVFQLGCKYSEKMDATIKDSGGDAKPLWMGCYGIGISRIVAACIEQNHDEQGIIWPLPIAPFQVHLVALANDENVRLKAHQVYEQLKSVGIEVLLDDRDERPGVLFADAMLLGIPYQIVMGRKGLERGVLEFKERGNPNKIEEITFPKCKDKIKERIQLKMANYLGRLD